MTSANQLYRADFGCRPARRERLKEGAGLGVYVEIGCLELNGNYEWCLPPYRSCNASGRLKTRAAVSPAAIVNGAEPFRPLEN